MPYTKQAKQPLLSDEDLKQVCELCDEENMDDEEEEARQYAKLLHIRQRTAKP